MRSASIKEINTYVSRRNNTVAQYIYTRPILELCLEVERRPGSRVPKRWWYQYGLLFPGRQVAWEEVRYGYRV